MINEEGLRDWFGKSKSKDGKSGWVNVVTGDSCASDKPGEGVPKCVSSSKRASMSKKERKAAAAAKRREDPGQQSKSGAAKPTMVKTDRKTRKEEMEVNEARKPGESPQAYADRMKKKFAGGKSKTYDPMKDKNFDHDKAERTRGSMQEADDKKGKGSGSKDACYHKVKSRYSVWPSAYASGALVKCRKVGAANWGNSTKKEEYMALPEFSDVQINAMRKAGVEVEVVDEACWKGYEKKGMKTMFGKRYPNCVKKTKKEEVEHVDEACWDTHEQRGMKKKGGKMVPNCVPKGSVKKEEVTGGILVQDAQDFKPREIESVDIIKPEPIKGGQVDEAVRTKVQTGNMYQVIFGWRGKMMMVKLFFPELSVPTRQKVADALDKMYPGSQLRSYSHSIVDYDDPYINVGEETVHESVCEVCGQSPCVCPVKESYHSDWRTELEEDKGMEGMTQKGGHKRSTESGAGLTQKGVEKYRRQNPGSKLKTAVTTPPSKLKPGSKAANRRKSFCARSRGWTGERGKAARRRWNCQYNETFQRFHSRECQYSTC